MQARRSRPRQNRTDPVASLRDHDVRRLDHRKRIVADLQSEIVDGLVGDRRGDDHPAADIDTNMGRRLTLSDAHDLAFELIAGAKLHSNLLAAAAARSILSDIASASPGVFMQ